MEPYEPHLAIATALAVGLLVGLEREQKRPEHPGSMLAGVRTYPIIAVIGALATLLEPASLWLPLIALAGVIALVAISYYQDVKKHDDHGITTESSLIAVYLLGALSASRGAIEPMETRFLLVMALGVVLTVLLSSKEWLHGIASRVSKEDYYATIKFLIVAVIVLPLLPDRSLGPWDAINPFDIGVVVVLISALSFIGYIAIRLLGAHRGLLASAALGGMVSSTAVTMSFAGRTKENPALAPVAAGAIAVASIVMLVRIGVLVAIAYPLLLPHVALPLAGATIGAVVAGFLVYRSAEGPTEHAVAVTNPFELGTAIRFGLLFGAILLATSGAKHYLGDQGLYAASALAGLTDVDAITLSNARLARGGLSVDVATLSILIAAAVNTIVKSSLALALGTRRLGVRAFVIGGLIVVGAAVGIAVAAVAL